jgi:hypothetical protein
MILEVLNASTMAALFVVSLFLPKKRKPGSIRIPKNYRDTSNARYAINERGYLEEIHKDKFSSRPH